MRRVIVRDLVSAGVLRVEDGNHGEYRPRPDEFVDDGVPFIRAADMTSGTIDFNGAGKVNAIARARIRKGIGRPGDVILSHKGTVGRVAVAPMDSPDFVCSPQTTFWRSLDESVLSQQYLRYVMRSPDFVGQLDVLKGQTDMAPYVSLTDQRTIELDLPSIAEQQAIAEILSALDDKAEANTRLTSLLVGLADAHFVRFVAGASAGPLTFEDVAEIGGGGTPRTSVAEYWNGEVYWATPTDVTGLSAPYLWKTSRKISQIGLASCSSKLYPVRSILMTSRATIGAFAVAQIPLAVNQGFIVVNAIDAINQWWLLHEMRARVDEFMSYANGATFLELPRGKFKKLPVRIPASEDARAFASAVAPLHESAAHLMTETERLTLTRDELLPLLMSGKIRVRDVEKVVEEVV
jgi:type I restriction enzyme S subunit